jgi:heme ABC exporter, ATP-binding protein CcmA
MLEALGLTCERDERTLFRDLSFCLEAGEVLLVEGQNGSGKTSLLRILCGLSAPDAGVVRWQGRDIQRLRTEYFANLAYLGHAHGLKAELSPLENLEVARALATSRPGATPEQALERVGLLGFEEVPCRTLSAGQRRRVALARMLLTPARLWILDEPFTGIDRHGIEELEALLVEHSASGGIMVLSSHYLLSLRDCRLASIHLGV